MARKRLPKSLRKYIRKEKARIRREVLDIKEQEKQIQELYQKLIKKKLPEVGPRAKPPEIQEKLFQKTG